MNLITWQTVKSQIKQWDDRYQLWMAVPVACAALLVLLVLVKSCQGIVYANSNECRILRIGYPPDEAKAIAEALTDEQADSLIARNERDTLACPVVNHRYFIADNFERYLTYHKNDTAAGIDDIIAVVNAGADRKGYSVSIPSDTSKGVMILVNKYNYLTDDYRPKDMVPFNKTCSYSDNQASRDVVEAFVKMHDACKAETGRTLLVSSSYRSFDHQRSTHKKYHDNLVAQPGYSEHQTGLSIDVTSLEHPEKWAFGKSKEGIWVRENCYLYGFILRYPEGKAHITGYDYEPWHLRYVGIEAAKRIHDEGITLDEYYAYYLDRETK